MLRRLLLHWFRAIFDLFCHCHVLILIGISESKKIVQLFPTILNVFAAAPIRSKFSFLSILFFLGSTDLLG